MGMVYSILSVLEITTALSSRRLEHILICPFEINTSSPRYRQPTALALVYGLCRQTLITIECGKLLQLMNEQTNEGTNERANERKNERTNERASERENETNFINKQTIEGESHNY